jgi:hypothetical protein
LPPLHGLDSGRRQHRRSCTCPRDGPKARRRGPFGHSIRFIRLCLALRCPETLKREFVSPSRVPSPSGRRLGLPGGQAPPAPGSTPPPEPPLLATADRTTAASHARDRRPEPPLRATRVSPARDRIRPYARPEPPLRTTGAFLLGCAPARPLDFVFRAQMCISGQFCISGLYYFRATRLKPDMFN